MSKKKKRKENRCCESCANLIPIGEGDHICTECGAMPVMVLSDYEPTEFYYECAGKKWEER